jgi:ABC-type cobalamin/Fe3+-siderophores transport system ATPase subunit
MEEIKLEIPRIPDDPNPIKLTPKNCNQFFIVGRNGSGKSALIQRFVRVNRRNNRVKWIAAHRQTWFKSGGTDFTPASRQQYERDVQSYYSRDDARYKDSNAAQNLSAILFDLVAKASARSDSIALHVDNHDIPKAQEISAQSPSPFNQINELLALGTLTVTLEKSNEQNLLARHPQGAPFSIEEMSDGERNAMIIATHVITAESGTVLLIDEPERHLHRSIIQPFLTALFDLRSEDCAFIISTHEIALPVANPDARVLMLRSCQWNGSQCVAWDAEVLEPNSELPEDFKLAILGSRKKILFVEGESDSLDLPLYTALFPGLSVIPKGSCEEVRKAVFGLRESQHLHHVEAFGLIDRDNRTNEEIEKLAESGVFALEVYSVEALYYCSDAIAAVAHRQAESFGCDANELIKSVKQEAIEVMKGHANEMAARMCERRIKKLAESKIPKWKSIMSNPTQSISVPIDSQLYFEELNRFNKLVEAGELDQLVARYPMHKSCTRTTISKALKCPDKNHYERMVLAQLKDDNILAQNLKKRIDLLSKTVNQAENPPPNN